MDNNWRLDQLKQWEEDRKGELRLDLYTHATRSFAGFVIFSICWAVVARFRPTESAKLLVAFVAGAYLAGTVIVWLRRWGAYIERRLTEIEARLVNSRPAYYIGGDLESIEPNPLFEKLDRIERFVERISKL